MLNSWAFIGDRADVRPVETAGWEPDATGLGESGDSEAR